MSRPLVKDEDAKRLRLIQAHLQIKPQKPAVKIIELPVEDAEQLSQLLQDILKLQPIVIDEYITPNDAAELSGVSRPVIIEMLKNGGLEGHQVNTHWKVQKKSLLKYMANRDRAGSATAAMDEDGFGLD